MVPRKREQPPEQSMSEPTECVFCRIVRGDFGTQFVAESESAVAFRDIQPSAPTHILVIPRKHVESLQELLPGDSGLAGELLELAARVARIEGIAESGYRVVTNVGADSGQTVFHLHFHVLGGRRLNAGMG
jgi:histidine triad (HIT) family protein